MPTAVSAAACCPRLSRDKRLCFDGQARSTAWLQLLAMVRHGVVADDELTVFGGALRASVTSRRPALDPGLS